MKHNYSAICKNIKVLPMNEQESELYRKLRNRNDNRSSFFNQGIIEEEQQKAWYRQYLKRTDEVMLSVHLIENGEFIGALGIYDIDIQKGLAEVGRIIIDKKKCQGKGYGTESLIAINQIAGKIGLKQLYAYIYSDNPASLKSFQRAGYFISDTDDSKRIVKVIYELK